MAKKKVPFKQVVRSITGLSTPVFGVSWNPPPDKRDIIRGLVTFLEDRRALYMPYHMEYGPWVTQSVLEIRQEITETLKRYPADDDVLASLRAMRAACRKFLDEHSGPTKRIRHPYADEAMMWASLGELRGVFGLHLARLCVAFGIDVEPELSSVFPIEDGEASGED